MAERNEKGNQGKHVSRRGVLAGFGAVASAGLSNLDVQAQDAILNQSIDLSGLISKSEIVSEQELRVWYQRLADELVANEKARQLNGWLHEYSLGDLRIRAGITSGEKTTLVIWVFSDKVAILNTRMDRFSGAVFSYICDLKSDDSVDQSTEELHTYRPIILNGRRFESTRPGKWLTSSASRSKEKFPDLLTIDPSIARKLIKGTIESILSRM